MFCFRDVSFNLLSVGIRYFSDKIYRQRVYAKLDAALAELARKVGPDAPLVIAGHGLGTVVSNDFIRLFQ